ncbi:MAG: hypothetical protein A2359_04610 [Candidatus Moranbacteria bacterium RIFOXYB1_FULL_43_19]|nr:MAG: hypothetical protein A2359_04610 [Candidatus Moranbacteria bacterium RIFOXYB1_FULL_43_19]OGI33890.1 MAG: hypothetical protein A2420_01715 [Candidatus Moranbacteria bacterium RIFOXYC1_FULL_44_13]OGI38296.1 MAG: hypothetical protein A2612_03730 [Candidatus Moranbacteria bacterium RIFOXYD1_FULL_44_12]
MPYILLGGPLAGILTALVSVVAEQFLAAAINIFSGREVVLDVYTHLGFFLVAAAIIEESFKYFSAVFVLRRYLGLNRFKFVSASLIAGIFFGGAETYLVLLTNGKRIWEIGSLDGNTFFSLSALVLLHILTYLLISVLIASREEKAKFQALRTIIFPILIHLLFNFLIIQKGDFTNWLVEIVLGITFLVSFVIIAFNFRKLAR